MERELLYQRIYDDLLQGIQDQSYPAGSRLPSEKELSEKYGVSRITSKKALEMLADKGLISRTRGRGSYVLENLEVAAELEEKSGLKISRDKKMIGVVFDDFSSAFGSDILHGIEHECRNRDYYLVFKCTYGNVDEEEKAIKNLIELGVEGIVLMCVQGETYSSNLLKLVVDKFPIVLVDRKLVGLPIPCISTDNYSAAKDLMQLLFENGHNNICFLSHPYIETSTVAARFNGYLDSMLEHGIAANETMWIRDLGTGLPRKVDEKIEADADADVERVERYIRENPQVTGFFAVEQSLGCMVYKILKKLGQENEKEVVFFDGIIESFDMNANFSCVFQGQYEIGAKAVQYLSKCFRGEALPIDNYVPYSIVKREQ